MNKNSITNYLKKPDVSKRFYQVPNEIMRLGLSVGEIAVYNYLMYCEDHKTYRVIRATEKWVRR